MKFPTCARRSAVLVVALGIALPGNSAEPKKKPAAPESTEPAYLRIWKGDFASKRTVKVIRRGSGRKGSAGDLIETAEGYRFGDYNSVAAGACTLEVIDAAEPGTKLASINASLAAGSFSTLLLQEKKGAVVAELLDDTATHEGIAELIVRNFDPNLKSIQIDAGADFHARLVSPESFLDIRGLPRTRVQIESSGEDSSGQSLKWTNDVDFSKFRRATVLIYPDPYGRIRPRVVVDGEIIAAHEDAPAK